MFWFKIPGFVATNVAGNILLQYPGGSCLQTVSCLAVDLTNITVMSVQDKLICVHLVMPRCMFRMLFLSEIVSF